MPKQIKQLVDLYITPAIFPEYERGLYRLTLNGKEFRELTIDEVLAKIKEDVEETEKIFHEEGVRDYLYKEKEGRPLSDPTVPKSAFYYIRTSLQVTLMHEGAKLRWLESVRDDEQNPVPDMYKHMLRGEIAFSKQWLKEAKEEFSKLPEEIRPTMTGEEYE